MIYAIQAGEGGPIKFGRARNPLARLAELQTGCHETLMLVCSAPLNDDIERQIHEGLRDERIRGEWFRPSEATLKHVEMLRDAVRAVDFGYALDPELCPCCAFSEAHAISNGWWPDDFVVE